MTSKLELYDDTFELETVLERGPSKRLAAELDPRAGRMLEGVAAFGKGERESLHLYHGEQADAVLSDDRVFLRLLEENAVPYLTPAGPVVRLFEIEHLGLGEALDTLDKLEGTSEGRCTKGQSESSRKKEAREVISPTHYVSRKR